MHGDLHRGEGKVWRPVRHTLWTTFLLVSHTYFFAVYISMTSDLCGSVKNKLKLRTVYARSETNLVHKLSSVCSVSTPLHVSGLLVIHHQEAAMYTCDNWYVLYISVDCWQAWMAC
jgi:hypothetical protein